MLLTIKGGIKMKIAHIILLATTIICHTYAVSISGVVKKKSGEGIEGVKVRLGKAAITTTTGPDGSFLLTDATGIMHKSQNAGNGNDCPFQLGSNMLCFSRPEQSGKAALTIYEYKGRVASSKEERLLNGRCSMAIPLFRPDGVSGIINSRSSIPAPIGGSQVREPPMYWTSGGPV